MNNQRLILIGAISLLSTIFAISGFVLLGFSFEMDTVYSSAIIGVLPALVLSVIYHLRNNVLVKQMDYIKLFLKRDEEVVIDGIAMRNNQIGKLFLTTKQVVFLPKSLQKSSLVSKILLSNICNVTILKKAGVVPSGIILHTEKEDLTYQIDFADDWKCLIEWQLLIMKARDKSLRTGLQSNDYLV